MLNICKSDTYHVLRVLFYWNFILFYCVFIGQASVYSNDYKELLRLQQAAESYCPHLKPSTDFRAKDAYHSLQRVLACVSKASALQPDEQRLKQNVVCFIQGQLDSFEKVQLLQFIVF